MSLATIDFTQRAVEALARQAGYECAADALIDLTTEPFEPYGDRDGGVLLSTYAELAHATEAERLDGFYVTDQNRKTPAPYATNVEANAHRRVHRHRDAIAQMRHSGLSNDEQAVLLNRLDNTDSWTRAKVAHVASQQGLTKVGKPLARGVRRG